MEVATALMTERGYAATTVADVAAEAGVSVALVYSAFGNKVGLLTRVVDAAIAGDDDAVPVRDRPEAAAVAAATSARTRCALTARLVAGIAARTAPLEALLHDAAGSDPEAAAMLERSERGRRTGMGEFVDILAGSDQLRPGLSPERAADIAWVLTDPVAYRRLVSEQGWTPAEYEGWLADALYDGLCARRRRTST